MSDLLTLTAPVAIEAAAPGKPKRLSIVAYTGGEMSVDGFGPLVLALDGLELPASLPILTDHQNRIESIVANGTPSVSKGTLIVSATLVDSEAARRVVNLIESGADLQASLGAVPSARQFIAPRESVKVNSRTFESGERGLTVITKATLREVSITAIGADSATAVAIAARKGTEPMTIPIDHHQIRREERERIQTIDRLCLGDWPDRARVDALRARAVDGELTVEQLQGELLGIIRAARPSGIVNRPVGMTDVASPNVLAAAALCFMGRDELAAEHYGDRATQQARDMRCHSLLDLCERIVSFRGEQPPHGRMELVKAAMGPSTYSLPVSLGDAANNILLQSYTESPATWRTFAQIRSATDFKQHSAIRPSGVENLAEIPSAGEVKHTTISESVYTYRIDTFARNLSIDRRAIVNDDLSLFDSNAMAFGKAAARSVADLAYAVLLGNSGSFFHANNSNLETGGGSVLSSTSLGTVIKKMINQRDASGNDLDIRPATLLVPPDLRQTAIALLESDFLQQTVAGSPTGNTLKGSLSLVVEPRLNNSTKFSGTSTTAWYVFASPQDGALITAFLNGVQVPTVEFFAFDSDPRMLTASWRVYFDYGAALADPKAAQKSNGA